MQVTVSGATLGEAMPPRVRWADVQDSSQENASCSQPGPPLSQSSYHSPSQDHSPSDIAGSGAGAMGSSGLPTRLASAATLRSVHDTHQSDGVTENNEALLQTEKELTIWCRCLGGCGPGSRATLCVAPAYLNTGHLGVLHLWCGPQHRHQGRQRGVVEGLNWNCRIRCKHLWESVQEAQCSAIQ